MRPHEGRTYAVTGARSGIGAATVAAMRAAGARVITVDLSDADITGDLGELDQLDTVAEQILEHSRGTLHGYVNGAGVGPTSRKPSRILAVNAFAAIGLMTRLRPAFERAENPRVTVISSNTITCHPNPISAELIQSCLVRPHEEMLKRVDEEIAPVIFCDAGVDAMFHRRHRRHTSARCDANCLENRREGLHLGGADDNVRDTPALTPFVQAGCQDTGGGCTGFGWPSGPRTR